MTLRIARHVVRDIVRSRIVLTYTALLAIAAVGLFNLGGVGPKGIVSLLSVVLLIVPVAALVFGTSHFYNSYEFIELLAAQPIPRRTIFLGEFLGVSLALVAAYFCGIGIPVLLYDGSSAGLMLVGVGSLLTLGFVALAFLGAVLSRDKARGIGVALMMWFYFTLVYDGIVVFLLYSFSEYPMEKAAIVMVSLNPIDLGRVLMLLQMDVSALMGYTGAVLGEFLGTTWGVGYATALLVTWVLAPLGVATHAFKRKDL